MYINRSFKPLTTNQRGMKETKFCFLSEHKENKISQTFQTYAKLASYSV